MDQTAQSSPDLDLKAWIGRSETTRDVATPGVYRLLAGVLDHDTPPWRAGQAPPLGHWLNFLPEARQGEIGADGHPKRGGFLPPVDLPRRMWAGSRLTFLAPIALGDEMVRRSTVETIEPKTGRSGEMVFVTVRHEVSAGAALAVREEQDIVYREAPRPGGSPAPATAAAAPGPNAEWTRTVAPDPVLLFRYSALTYNAHRIHYDRDFAVTAEGYPGLVVHGPLIATLLLDHYLRRHPGARIASFSFRAQSPLFDIAPFELNGRETNDGAELWASAQDGPIAMKASLIVS
jgi:3-methylfumaryl-CoA hydratase